MIRSLIFLFVVFAAPMYSLEGDREIWKLIYEGNSSICMKYILARQAETIEDKMISQSMLVYYFFKKNQTGNSILILHSMDRVLSYEFYEIPTD